MNQTCLEIEQSNRSPVLQSQSAGPLAIGGLALRNRAILAPMSGVTDVAFRRLAWSFGAGMVVSEMVASEALNTGHDEMRLKAESAGLPVHIVQLAGREARWMGEATRLAEDAGASVIDINMGCPSKRVTNGYSGSALMRDLDHALGLIEAVVDAASVPVTLKMRLGWDKQSINAPQLAKRAQDAGVQLITVHGRTRDEFYKGEADWAAVRAVREATALPLIVNGDIRDAATARQALGASGADGVMVGRASYGAPWIVAEVGAALAGEPVSLRPRSDAFADFVVAHFEAVLSLYGAHLGVRNFRKHIDWYSRHLPAGAWSPDMRRAVMTSEDVTGIARDIRNVFRTVDDDAPSVSLEEAA
ncbi:MAG: tRNA dihydrouridine synthase DusB [Pseudomonadota bacterium]